MKMIRIKQAQCALSDGRLDEAYELAMSKDFQAHRNGQQLIGRLSRALVKRGRRHLDENRVQQALSDCDKAQKLAGNFDEAAHLRAAICDAMGDKLKEEKKAGLKLAQARDHIRQGRFNLGEKLLGEMNGKPNADLLLLEAQGLQMEIVATCEKAAAALDRGDLDVAIETVCKSSLPQTQDTSAQDLITRIKSKATDAVSECLNNGRIDRADALLGKLSFISNGSLALADLEYAVNQCQKVGRLISRGDNRKAVVILEQLKLLLPKARWVSEAIGQARQVTKTVDQLLAGPLGLTLRLDSNVQTDLPNNSPKPQDRTLDQRRVSEFSGSTERPQPNRQIQTQIGQSFVVQIDNVGSFLVLRKPNVTIGPVSSSKQPDVGLMAPSDMPTAMIERSEEDYFLRSSQPIDVNGRAVTQKLLFDGDRLSLSSKCRFTFALPNAASSTAVLKFSSARFGRLDIRQVILMDRELILAADSQAHIRVDSCPEPVILFLQDDQLHCRTKQSILVDGRVADARRPLVMNQPIRIAEVSLVITES